VTDLLEQIFEFNPGIAVRRIKGEIFFITPTSAELHTLNESGIEIWEMLQEGKPPSEIISTIIQETDGPPETIQSDIIELFQLLLSKGILRVKP
jgi:hypothetical protein